MQRKTHQGFGLVELMIALFLGLLVSSAALELFMTHRKVYNLQQTIASVQERGRYAIAFLSDDLKMAGFSGQGQLLDPIEFVQAADGVAYDTLMSRYGDDAKDCTGSGFNQIGEPHTKQYYVKNQQLYCKDSDGNTDAMINHVDAFQILYGIDLDEDPLSDAGYGVADAYLSGSKLYGQNQRVVSVRFAILIRSEHKINITNVEANTLVMLDRVMDKSSVSFGDGYLRRLFVSTIALRNGY